MNLISAETVSQWLQNPIQTPIYFGENCITSPTWTLNIQHGRWLLTGRNPSNSLRVNLLRDGKHGDWIAWVANSQPS